MFPLFLSQAGHAPMNIQAPKRVNVLRKMSVVTNASEFLENLKYYKYFLGTRCTSTTHFFFTCRERVNHLKLFAYYYLLNYLLIFKLHMTI